LPESDGALLVRAAEAAAEVALAYRGGPLDIRLKAQDGSPVTAADLAVNDRLEQILRTARPGYGWLSEESADAPARLASERVFIIDPIDGTRSFIEGEDSWAHSLAIAERGEVIAAAVLLPVLGLGYAATRGRGATLNGAPLTVTRQGDLTRAHVQAPKPVLDPGFWRGTVPGFRRSHRPSLAWRLALVAEARYDAMLTFRPTWEWDIAAGTLILQEAGARVTDRFGRPLAFNARSAQHEGVIAANPALHDDILARLHPR